MADVMRYRYGPKVELALKKTGTVAISVGDILRVGSSGRVRRVTASSDATSLVGVAMTASPTTDPTATVVKILQPGFGTVFEYEAAAGYTYLFGHMFKLTSAEPQQLTKAYTSTVNINVSASNVVAICVKELEATGTTVRVTFLGSKFNKTITDGA